MGYKERQREYGERLIKEGFFDDAGDGRFFGKPRPFVLKDRLKNIYPSIRTEALQYFRANRISWWGGYFPTGHVLSSQIACLNHLYPLRYDKDAVLRLLQTVSADFDTVLPIDEHMGGYIQFEAVGGDTNLINEESNTRGSNCTSVDALIYAQNKDGRRFLVPIEWKYVETYGNTDKSTGDKGETRKSRYVQLIQDSEYLNGNTLGCCWYEPFYQLMRQTLWTERLIAERIKGFEAEDYLHIHVVPEGNNELLRKIYPCSKKGLTDT